MYDAAQRQDFETAKQMRDTIEALEELKRKQAMEVRNSKLQNKINKSNNEALIQENRKKEIKNYLKLKKGLN